MKTTYKIFRPGKEPELCSVDWPEEPGYTRIAALIDPLVGGNLEHVSVLYEGRRADMFVDEMGHVHGLSEHNEIATKIYRNNAVSRGAKPDSLPTIVGTAVLFDRLIWV